jgi:ribonuclease D
VSEPLVTTAEALAGTLGLMAPFDRVAIDTEADSLHSYFEKLCLIQISIPGRDFLVDPLADVPLSPLFDSLETRELVIHGADFDLRLLRRAGQRTVGRVFDTMIAARLTGRLEFSYSALVTERFGVVLTKSSQKANWGLRPLPAKMADYAVNDTHYLLPLAEILEAELRALGRWGWLREFCERVAAASAITRERDLDNAWRVAGSADLDRRGAAILRALWHWREGEAKKVDRPAFHILRSEELVESAARFLNGDSIGFRHLSGGRRKRFFAAADAALALPESEWPIRPFRPRLRPTPEEEERFRALKTRRDAVAAELRLDPSLIASKAALEALAGNRDEGRLLPWQLELLLPH